MTTTGNSLEKISYKLNKATTQNRQTTASSKANTGSKRKTDTLSNKPPKMIWIQNVSGSSSPVKLNPDQAQRDYCEETTSQSLV